MTLKCFKAYDVRGKVPNEIDGALIYKIARSFTDVLEARKVVIGHDIRHESKYLFEYLKQGLLDAGVEVINIGLCGTEEIYFNTTSLNTDGGLMVTASHNPIGYSGLKFVSRGSKPISGDSGLKLIENKTILGNFLDPIHSGHEKINYDKKEYVGRLLDFVDIPTLKPLRIVFDSGNGSAGAVINQITSNLPFDCVFINQEPDGDFPSGVPNPLLPENRSITSAAVKESGADFGVAWDGDFDRCFFYDENGRFIEGYYLVGLLAEVFLSKNPGAKIVHDPRLTWNTVDIVERMGGIPIESKTGHAFIKERMRQEDATYGGEMSAHHYFKDFAYCDSGMIPWLMISELVSKSGKSLSELVGDCIKKFPCSGEINYFVDDVAQVLKDIREYYSPQNPVIHEIDGLSMSFNNWRFNIRSSNTEPLLRLNVESRGDICLVGIKVKEIESIFKK